MVPVMIEKIETISRCQAKVKVIDSTKNWKSTVWRVCKAVAVYQRMKRKMDNVFNEVSVSHTNTSYLRF